MAEQVVKDLRVTAREEGVQLVANRLTALQGASRAAAASISEVGVATEQSARRTANSAQALSRYAERMSVNSKAVRDYLRDQKALDGGLASGALSVQGYARELQRIQQAFQNFRLPGLADQSALNELLRVRAGVDGVTNAARESARAFEEAFARQKAWGTSLDQGFGFDRVGRDASEAAASFDELFRNQEKVGRGFRDLVNQRVGVFDGVTRSAREASAAFEELIANQDRVARQVRSGIDARLGIGRAPGRAAEDSMDAFAPMFRQEEAAAAAYAKRLAEVRAQIDPLAAAQQRLTTELAEYQAMATRGDLSSADLAKATEMANDGFQIQAVRIGAVGEAAKLTGNQMLNLSRQANDVATMAAMGMPISMIVTSQLGQIYGALEENSRGVRGSIEAISNAVKGFFAGLGPVSIALGALSVAAVAFGLATRRNVEPIEDVIKGQADAVRDLREAYGLAGDAAAEYVRRSPQAVRVGVVSDNEAALSRAREEIENRRAFQFSGMENNRYNVQTERFGGMKQAFDALAASAAAGTPRFTEFEDALAKIAESDIDDHARDVIKANLEWVRSLVPLQNELVGMERSLDAGAVAIERMGVAFGRSIDKLRDFVPAVSQARQIDIDFEDAAANARTMSEMLGAVDLRDRALAELARPAQESLRDLQDELSALDLSPLERELDSVMRDYGRRFDEYQRTTNDAVGLAAILEEREVALQLVRREAAREEEARRAGYDLDLRAVAARTAAEKAAIESERVRIDLMTQGHSATEAATRATEAYALAIARSSEEWTRAAESRQFAREDALANAQAEVNSFGMTAGAAQAYGQATQQLTAYRRAAAEAGMPIDPAEEQAIRDAASAAGAYADALQRMNMERDQRFDVDRANAEAASVYASDAARRQALVTFEAEAELRRQNIDLGSEWARSYVEQELAIDGFRSSIERQSAVWDNIRGAGEGAIDGIVDRLAQGRIEIGDLFAEIAADITKAMLELSVANPLKNALLGTDLGTMADVGGMGGLFNRLMGKGDAPIALTSLGMRGDTAVNPMFVSVVGGGVGGGAGNAITRLLNPANGNISDAGATWGGGNSDMAAGIRATAASLGIRAQDLATVISYETGGTFDPLKRGPTTQWGQHRGLIQFGEPQAKQYGVDWSDPIGSQLGPDGALAKYMRNAGVRPGHGLLDVYSAVNAGSVGRYNASDANNGGAWGTVRDKVEQQMAGHMRKAEQLLGGAADSIGSTASSFASGLDLNSRVMIDGMEGSIADFLPKFGGNLEKLLSSVGGSASSGGVGSLFGGPAISAGARAAILANPGGGLYDTGGYTGPGGKYDVAGLVHRDEFVFSKEATNRIGVGTLEAIHRGALRGYASGGYVSAQMPVLPTYAPVAAASGSGVRVSLNVVNNGEPVEATQQQRDDGNGGIAIDVILDRKVAENASRRGTRTNQALRHGMGNRAPTLIR